MGANRPDLVIKDKSIRKAYIIDVSCPCDLNIYKMEATKVAKYVGLRGQLQKMWGYNCITIPIIIGGLGAVTTNIKDYLAFKSNQIKQFISPKARITAIWRWISGGGPCLSPSCQIMIYFLCFS